VPELSRRAALKTLTAVAVGTATGAAAQGFAYERHRLQLVEADLSLSGLPSAFDGVRVGFITDLHHSPFVGLDEIQRAADLIANARPDLILLGGDYVTDRDRRYADPCAEVLAHLEAPLGVFAVLGNHDDERYVPAALSSRHIVVLRDEWTAITRRTDRLALAGVRFWTKGVPDIARALRGLTGPALLAAHDPRRIVEAAALDVGGVLAGHTHGGQIVLPGLGALAARKFPIAFGKYRRESTDMFVSRGVGTVIVPVRIQCPPDVALVTLRRSGEL
jgi:uncharacterized protein